MKNALVICTIVLSMASALRAGPITSGLELWLKSDTGVTVTSGKVSQWDDQATAVVQNATQSNATVRPTLTTATVGALTNHPVVHFSGAQYMDFLLQNANTYTGMTFFFVGQATNTPRGSTLNSTLEWVLTSGVTASPGIRWAMGLGENSVAGIGWAGSNGSTFLGTGANLSSNQFYINSYSKSATSWSIAVNGTARPSVSDSTLPTSDFNGIIGAENSVLAYAFTGDVAEILIYNRALNTTETAQVFKYLNEEFSLVPEPASIAWLLVGGAVIMAQRRA